ncbi:biliverdin-producing heme oxygenase [Roseobacter sp.]|uniref:biliverdin-producing heme oxygenase n=1 Tax=Roseobacter sp. TaxID=1907202 RepID=UPI0032981516
MSDLTSAPTDPTQPTDPIAPGAIRKVIAAATDDAHQMLHRHAWISRLIAPSLHLQDYTRLLAAYYQFYLSVEHARACTRSYDTLSVRGAIAALHADLTALGAVPETSSAPDLSYLDTAPKVLGALYVMHGSSFGARQMRSNIKRVLPDAPRAYFETPTASPIWHHLTTQLDATGGTSSTRDTVITAANQTFVRFGAFVTFRCEQQD